MLTLGASSYGTEISLAHKFLCELEERWCSSVSYFQTPVTEHDHDLESLTNSGCGSPKQKNSSRRNAWGQIFLRNWLTKSDKNKEFATFWYFLFIFLLQMKRENSNKEKLCLPRFVKKKLYFELTLVFFRVLSTNWWKENIWLRIVSQNLIM